MLFPLGQLARQRGPTRQQRLLVRGSLLPKQRRLTEIWKLDIQAVSYSMENFSGNVPRFNAQTAQCERSKTCLNLWFLIFEQHRSQNQLGLNRWDKTKAVQDCASTLKFWTGKYQQKDDPPSNQCLENANSDNAAADRMCIQVTFSHIQLLQRFAKFVVRAPSFHLKVFREEKHMCLLLSNQIDWHGICSVVLPATQTKSMVYRKDASMPSLAGRKMFCCSLNLEKWSLCSGTPQVLVLVSPLCLPSTICYTHPASWDKGVCMLIGAIELSSCCQCSDWILHSYSSH